MNQSHLFSLYLCFLSFSTLFLIWAVRNGEKLKTTDLDIMEYLGGYCIKTQPAKVGLEDLRRQSLTQTLYKSKLGESTGPGAAVMLKALPPSLVKTHVETYESVLLSPSPSRKNGIEIWDCLLDQGFPQASLIGGPYLQCGPITLCLSVLLMSLNEYVLNK